MAKKNPHVFMDVSIDGDPFERMVFELFYDIAPKTAENFRALCTGEKGISPSVGKPLHYKGSFFHRIIKGSVVQGTGGESIYSAKFPDESPRLKHDTPGLLSMSIADHDTLGSHFIITLKADHLLDRKHVVFGRLVQGHNLLKKIEVVGDEDGHPSAMVKIVNCGEYNEDVKKLNKLGLGRDGSSEANSHEAQRKEKRKKPPRDRRKRRRRYHSSESDSSSDSDMETSESDSDSDSEVSSSSYLSSSSYDRRRKRKRLSRKEKHRRGKRRDKHHGKKRRREKRSKCKSRRDSDSLTDSDSESKEKSSSDGESLDVRGKEQKLKDHSQKTDVFQSTLAAEKDAPCNYRKRREEECPKENGERHSNGIQADSRSDRSEERQPDVVDDHPSKSRSRSTSPKRAMSKSISPRRRESRSLSVSPRRKLSRSPSGSRRPHAPSRRSFSRSPVRSVNRSPVRSISRSPSRSPVRGRKWRNVSRSPVKTSSRRSISKSPVRSPSRSRQSRSSPRASSRSFSRSPVWVSRKSVSRSPIRSSARSLSRSSGRIPSKRSIGRSSARALSRSNCSSYSGSPSPIHRVRPMRGRSWSRSVSPDAMLKRKQYSYTRRYRTPSRSPVRSYRINGRSDCDRYSSHRRYSPRRYRSPSPRRRTPPRYRSRRSRRTQSVSRSPPYYAHRYSRSRSPICSRSPVVRY